MSSARRPRLLLVGRTRYRLPLTESAARKLDALERELELRVVASAAAGNTGSDPRLDLFAPAGFLDGARFYLGLAARLRRALDRFEPDAILAEDPHTAWIALRVAHVPVIAEVHGDPRGTARLYGSPARRLIAPVLDRLQRSALRRAAAVRAISPFTAAIVERIRGEPANLELPTFTDLASFEAAPRVPLPVEPRLLFVGSLERVKGVDVLADAWPRVKDAVPEAELLVVGRGPLAPPDRAEHIGEVAPSDVSRLLDEAVALVLPSRSEGYGRVIVEAFARGRPVVASRVGGIPDLVHDGENGLLVEPGDERALADALTRILLERPLAERLADGAAASYRRTTPEEFAAHLRALVDGVLHT